MSAAARPGLLHVIGAGAAGLAAALEASRRGARVVLHEATPQAGGRARALPDGTDNGTHALLGANPAALGFLAAIGARDRWVEPEPAALPVYDLATRQLRRVALSPALWRDRALRPEGLSARGMLALLGAALPGRGGSVAAAFARHPALLRGFVEPLTLAALNTAPQEATLPRLAAVLRRMARPGACRLFVARDGLGPDLVQPALAALARQGVEYRPRRRLRALAERDGRATTLVFSGEDVPLGARDRVILALPPWEAGRLLPGLSVPQRHAPILNVHFARESVPGLRFIGLLGGLSHWVLLRPGMASVTISAAFALQEESQERLAPRLWAELRQAALAANLPGPWPEAPPPCRLVREQRATPLHDAGLPPPPPPRPLANLALAGDWLDPALPATLEAALRSGLRAARALA
ncbi:FAD-dependent oxidoreductase [Pseudoroseomonas cervicalis]|uniref:hydroxysqualene dehydroxylase n=1 Tax=Teichococcus cervicalis TaxID=204525 RepID=UPI002789A39E|nr:FAD-dependent oxidoreductase [Pseudoroseomonas cervicalis]MDQ1080569.1 glycine/D-amino acid oxidase-like deaminating enzyme [Pseudoroseomonas cervicalis]